MLLAKKTRNVIGAFQSVNCHSQTVVYSYFTANKDREQKNNSNFFLPKIFDTNGRLLHQFGTRGKADGQIWYPAGVCMSESEHIFVADHGNHRIQVSGCFTE